MSTAYLPLVNKTIKFSPLLTVSQQSPRFPSTETEAAPPSVSSARHRPLLRSADASFVDLLSTGLKLARVLSPARQHHRRRKSPRVFVFSSRLRQ
ncbi:hypothetical protein ACJRO7_021158 [Eucalyptus globulus]|uniref:Uncharacterized protein n=1 Tax=Eucalyptus globulus TaxID=34317 RepID=A0ABD3KKS8_EUCGL